MRPDGEFVPGPRLHTWNLSVPSALEASAEGSCHRIAKRRDQRGTACDRHRAGNQRIAPTQKSAPSFLRHLWPRGDLSGPSLFSDFLSCSPTLLHTWAFLLFLWSRPRRSPFWKGLPRCLGGLLPHSLQTSVNVPSAEKPPLSTHHSVL